MKNATNKGFIALNMECNAGLSKVMDHSRRRLVESIDIRRF